jgi:hypothetical protein
VSYFTNLFTSEVQATDPAVLEKIQPRITDAMNERLLAPFTAEDVKKAAFSIGDLKAPGPDGLHAIFYKKFWSICGEKITGDSSGYPYRCYSRRLERYYSGVNSED